MTNSITAGMSPADAQAMPDHASRQSDRWLFLACLVVLLICLVGAILYLAKWVRAVIDDMRKDRMELADVVRANTAVLTIVQDRLR